jgi:hypothetical protein
MKNATVLTTSSRVMKIRLKGAPERHGWALRYVSGVPDLSSETTALYVTDWHTDAEAVTFGWGHNAWLWEKEEEARTVVEFLRSNCEIETEAENV